MPTKPAIPQFIGARVKRREDPALITGRGQYVADITPDDALFMKMIRSPYAHARILEIDRSEAEALPGVVAILTAEELTPHVARPLPMDSGMGGRGYSDAKNPPRYPLASGKVRHVGDPVAVMVAESPYIAADAADLLFVDYDPLEPVVDPEAALGPDAPVLHEENTDNVAFRWSGGDEDIERLFEQADHVTELRLVNQRLIPNAMEPRAVTAAYSPGEGLTVWSTTQIPHKVADAIAAALTIPRAQVRVIAPEVGGGFGAKANVYAEEIIVPFLARKFERPVKWAATRSEDYVATIHGRDQINIIRLAATKEGRVQAAHLIAIADVGAYYARVTPAILPLTAEMMTGVYQIPHAKFEGMAVFTSKVATEPYRGAGRPEAAFLIERSMDLLADELGLDPADLRRRNFIAPEAFPYTTPFKSTYDSGEYERALTTALTEAGYDSLRAEQRRRRETGGPLLGIGLACYVEICGFGPWEMGKIVIDSEGKATVFSGTAAQGQGHQTTWAQIAAETLQLPIEDITVKEGDTGVVARGIGTFGSRSTPVGGSAVLQNAETVRDQAKQIAAHLLEAASADVVLQDGRFFVRGVPDRALGWREVARAAENGSLPEPLRGGLSSDEDFKPKGETYPFGTHICVVEVDPDSGHIELVRYLTVDDCGRVINPLLAEGQVHGGIAQGVGQALTEGARYDDMGNLVSGSLMDYALPKAFSLPSYETHRTETPSPLNPLGVKGIGEAATIGSTPATVNAVIDALSHLGIRHLDMPLTAEKVWRAIHEATTGTA